MSQCSKNAVHACLLFGKGKVTGRGFGMVIEKNECNMKKMTFQAAVDVNKNKYNNQVHSKNIIQKMEAI